MDTEITTLGNEYEDTATGAVGVATARCIYVSGHVSIEISNFSDGRIQTQWIDEPRLKLKGERKAGF